MKYLSFIAACALSFVLGTFVPLTHIHAQTSAPARMFYQISFMKTKPGQDAMKMERELWKPIHSDRANNGQINSWTVMQPVYSGPHPYDYITVEASNSLDSFLHTDYVQLMTKAWGKDKFESGNAQTMNARDMLGTELWVATESVSKQAK
ncbi:MAG: hypothetical protein ACR2IV_16590 [Bryobacteraceae bacterium]